MTTSARDQVARGTPPPVQFQISNPFPQQIRAAGRHGFAPAWLPARVAAPTIEQLGWTFAGVSVLIALVQVVPLAGSLPVISLLIGPGTCLVGVALWGMWRSSRVPVWCQWTLFATAALTVGLSALGTWLRDPNYATDAVAFNQYAAELLLQGTNPYGIDLTPSLDRFGVPPTFVTLTVDGGVVSHLSYPAAAILPVAALLVVGLDAQAANVVDVGAWLATVTVLMVILPRSGRWLAVALAANTLLAGMVTGGVTDPVYLVPLLLALWRWDRFGVRDAGLAGWMGPFMLGLACSVKQLPWFFAPFLLLGVVLEARRTGRPVARTALTYVGSAVAVFALVNAPFLVWDPRAFVGGVLLPLVQPLVPDGQGLASLIIQGGVGGGNLRALSLAGLAGLATLLALMLARYERWRAGWPVLVVLAFLLPSRSLSSYLLMAVPAVLVGITTVGPVVAGSALAVPARVRRIAEVVGFGLLATTIVAVTVALSAREPLDVTIVDSRGTGARQTVGEVVAEVSNTSDRPISPHYTVSVAGKHSGWWDPVAGGGPLDPGETRRVVLRAPGEPSMPGELARFQVTAFSGGNGSVSTSTPRPSGVVSLYLSPGAVVDELPVGQQMTFTVQVRDQWGRPSPQAGMQVALSQVVFAPTGVLPGTVSIADERVGKSPIIRRTGPDGSVTFTIEGQTALRDPVYVQAWLADDPENPRSFSNITSIRFVEPTG